MTQCPCGRPLHYSDPAIRAFVDDAIEHFGPTVAVTISKGTWFVPRHYYALHGLDCALLDRLAIVYQWEHKPKRMAPASLRRHTRGRAS